MYSVKISWTGLLQLATENPDETWMWEQSDQRCTQCEKRRSLLWTTCHISTGGQSLSETAAPGTARWGEGHVWVLFPTFSLSLSMHTDSIPLERILSSSHPAASSWFIHVLVKERTKWRHFPKWRRKTMAYPSNETRRNHLKWNETCNYLGICLR